MFTVKELQKVYHFGTESIEALKDVSFSVKRGEFVAIIGHSGSGKSTLLSVMGGLTRPTSGMVLIENEDLWSKNDSGRARIRNSKVGFIFQFASLIPTLNCLGNVMLPCLFNPRGLQWANQEQAQQLLQLVGLADKIYAYPHQLSGGQQRRVAIARALINNPILILADEPTSASVSSSKSPVGSSAKIKIGLLISARAIATRRCCPPESSWGYFLSTSIASGIWT